MKELAEQEINKDTCKLFNKVNKYKFQRSNGFTMLIYLEEFLLFCFAQISYLALPFHFLSPMLNLDQFEPCINATLIWKLGGTYINYF